MAIQISAAELPTKVVEILTRIQDTGERFVVERYGLPVAAVVSVDDLQEIESRTQEKRGDRAERLAALAMADAVRQQILTRRNGIPLPDSSLLLAEFREERDLELAGLH
jgi:antitoxin (DNA-binding transcriptional repressor) of toxin-antitoxin stability system